MVAATTTRTRGARPACGCGSSSTIVTPKTVAGPPDGLTAAKGPGGRRYTGRPCSCPSSRSMTAAYASDLAVVIPTRGRPGLLRRTLAALRAQTVDGFEVIVVVDGDTGRPRSTTATLTSSRRGAAPRWARRGPQPWRRVTARQLVLLLDDDTVPAPSLSPSTSPSTPMNPQTRWSSWAASLGTLTWRATRRASGWPPSGSRPTILRMRATTPVHPFRATNVSLKRSFFVASGGFDPELPFDHEDADLGWRLSQKGMRLRSATAALAEHLQPYGWPKLAARIEGAARGEFRMQAKHAWFQPELRARCVAPQRATSAASRRLPRRVGGRARPGGATRLPRRRLRPRRLVRHMRGRRRPRSTRPATRRPSTGRVRPTSTTSRPSRCRARRFPTSLSFADLVRHGRAHPRLRVRHRRGRAAPARRGLSVDFADFDNPSTRYLRWRLERRGADATVYDVDRDEIPDGYDAVYCFDVIEHIDDPFAFLAELEATAGLVMVNFLEELTGRHASAQAASDRRAVDHAAASACSTTPYTTDESIWSRIAPPAGEPTCRVSVRRSSDGSDPGSPSGPASRTGSR